MKRILTKNKYPVYKKHAVLYKNLRGPNYTGQGTKNEDLNTVI